MTLNLLPSAARYVNACSISPDLSYQVTVSLADSQFQSDRILTISNDNFLAAVRKFFILVYQNVTYSQTLTCTSRKVASE
jgi:hypothetical protein